MRFRLIIGLAAGLVCMCTAGLADAKPVYVPGSSFDGTCQLTGTLTLATPIGSTPRSTSFTGSQSGTCQGSLNGGPSAAHVVRNQVSGIGLLSCFGGHTLTNDVLRFDDGSQIRVYTDVAFAGVEAGGHFQGAGGDGVVEINLLPYFSQSTMDQCQAGTLTDARYDVTARTITPMVG
ncbi:MAG: hypothetical protein ACJ764_13055 [Solirubrobacteraceae bacterium]